MHLPTILTSFFILLPFILADSIAPSPDSSSPANSPLSSTEVDPMTAQVNITASPSRIRCNIRLLPRRRPWLRYCFRAIGSLPEGHAGYFHRGGPDDGFRLDGRPTGYDNCEVSVGIVGNREHVWSSWADIRGQALNTAVACKVDGTSNPTLTKGGSTVIGSPEGIKIEVRRKGFFVEDGIRDNVTELSITQ